MNKFFSKKVSSITSSIAIAAVTLSSLALISGGFVNSDGMTLVSETIFSGIKIPTISKLIGSLLVGPSAVVVQNTARVDATGTFTCSDTTKCSHDIADSSTSIILNEIQNPPHSKNYIFSFAASKVETPAFTQIYGIAKQSRSGSFDPKTSTGVQTDSNVNVGKNSKPQGKPSGPTVLDKAPDLSYYMTNMGDFYDLDRMGNHKGSVTNNGNWEDSYVQDGKLYSSNGVWEEFTVKTDSSKDLVVGGTAGKNYTVTLSVSAQGWSLANAKSQYGLTFDPTIEVSGTDYPCNTIKVNGIPAIGKPGKCQVSFPVVGGKTIDVTPTVTGSTRYTYGVAFVSLVPIK